MFEHSRQGLFVEQFPSFFVRTVCFRTRNSRKEIPRSYCTALKCESSGLTLSFPSCCLVDQKPPQAISALAPYHVKEKGGGVCWLHGIAFVKLSSLLAWCFTDWAESTFFVRICTTMYSCCPWNILPKGSKRVCTVQIPVLSLNSWSTAEVRSSTIWKWCETYFFTLLNELLQLLVEMNPCAMTEKKQWCFFI